MISRHEIAMRLSALIGLVALSLALLTGCHRNPEKLLASPGVAGAPNILKEIADHPGSPWKAWHLRAYHVIQIQAGAEPNVRAKLALWDDEVADHDTPIAELYFHDQTSPANPDPNDAKASGARRPYQLHYPASFLGVVIATLRNSNEAVYLFYYEKQWSVGVVAAEAIGVD